MNARSPYAGLIQQQRGAPGMGPGAGIRPAPRPQEAPRKQDSGGIGGMMSGMMGSMMSDERSKKEIERLEGANEALTAALSSSQASYPDTSAPSPGMQALGQQSSPADKVAAQNVGLGDRSYMQSLAPNSGANFEKRYSPSTADAREYPYTWAARDDGGRAIQVPTKGGMGQPDLSALDEAYRRMGQGG